MQPQAPGPAAGTEAAELQSAQPGCGFSPEEEEGAVVQAPVLLGNGCVPSSPRPSRAPTPTLSLRGSQRPAPSAAVGFAGPWAPSPAEASGPFMDAVGGFPRRL